MGSFMQIGRIMLLASPCFPSKILGELNPSRLHGKKALFMKIDLVEFSTFPHTSYHLPFKFW